jgi:hypothetical protein
VLLITMAVAGVLFVAIQFVPYGRDHSVPASGPEPAWDSPRTRELAVAACFDCHSNQTEWPWYSYIAPMSWLLSNDVMEGRHAFSFTPTGSEDEDADDAIERVLDGSMPPSEFTWLHTDARLTAAERQELATGLARTYGVDADGEGGGDRGGDNSGPGPG